MSGSARGSADRVRTALHFIGRLYRGMSPGEIWDYAERECPQCGTPSPLVSVELTARVAGHPGYGQVRSGGWVDTSSEFVPDTLCHLEYCCPRTNGFHDVRREFSIGINSEGAVHQVVYADMFYPRSPGRERRPPKVVRNPLRHVARGLPPEVRSRTTFGPHVARHVGEEPWCAASEGDLIGAITQVAHAVDAERVSVLLHAVVGILDFGRYPPVVRVLAAVPRPHVRRIRRAIEGVVPDDSPVSAYVIDVTRHPVCMELRRTSLRTTRRARSLPELTEDEKWVLRSKEVLADNFRGQGDYLAVSQKKVVAVCDTRSGVEEAARAVLGEGAHFLVLYIGRELEL